MGKWFLRIAIILVALIMIAVAFRSQIERFAIAQALKPTAKFAQAEAPVAPDYASDTVWAALPEREDAADFTPRGLFNDQEESAVDVFFIHPTTFITKEGWNQPLDHADTNEATDTFVMVQQASAFNGCCAIYAPRYRQATFWSFIDDSGQGEQALELAYSDVERAFAEFVARNEGRPFILAGHSQGSMHLYRLMEEQVSGTDLRNRLVAAYPVGFAHPPADFSAAAPDIPICQTGDDTGCYVTWNALGPKADLWWDETTGAACVNPLSWTTDDEAVDRSANLGSLSLSEKPTLKAGVTGAQCDGTRLLVGPLEGDHYKELTMSLGPDNYHVLDYSLFYDSIRRNAIDRTEAFLATIGVEEEVFEMEIALNDQNEQAE